MSAVTPEEERIGPEITAEENYNLDEGLALQLLCDFLHVPCPDIKDGKLVLLDRKTTEDEARRALCRILRNEKWGPPADVLDALVKVFDPGATDAALKAVLKRRSRGHANPYADMVIARAVSLLRFHGKHYDDAVAEVAAKFKKSAEHVKRIFGKEERSSWIVRQLPRRPRRKR
jgi:AraC-like DNA-binding protein